MPTARVLALMFLIVFLTVAAATAQNRAPNETSNEALDGPISTATTNPVYAPLVSLPDAPTPHRVIDKKFVAVMGALGGAESLRFTTRKLVLDREFAAGAPWVTRVPSNQHEIGEYAGFYAAELLVAYELKKPHSWLPGDKVIRKLWWAYPAAMVAIHIKNGVGNIRTEGPGGCTSIECATQMQ